MTALAAIVMIAAIGRLYLHWLYARDAARLQEHVTRRRIEDEDFARDVEILSGADPYPLPPWMKG